jgi:hypothetical protein
MSIALDEVHVFQDHDIHELTAYMASGELVFKKCQGGDGPGGGYELYYQNKAVVFETAPTDVDVRLPYTGESKYKRKAGSENDNQVHASSELAGVLPEVLLSLVDHLRTTIAPRSEKPNIYVLPKGSVKLNLKWVETENNPNWATEDRHYIRGKDELMAEARERTKADERDCGVLVGRSLWEMLRGQKAFGTARYRPVVWLINSRDDDKTKVTCSLRLCSLHLCDESELGETQLSGLDKKSISFNGTNVFFDGKQRLMVADEVRIKAFNAENDKVSSVISSFSDATYNFFESVVACANVENDPAFTVCLTKHEKYGNQLKIKGVKTSLLPPQLSPGSSISADGVVLTFQTYNFVDKEQQQRKFGVNCDLKAIYGARDCETGSANSTTRFDDIPEMISQLAYEVGSNEGNYFPFVEGKMLKLNLCPSEADQLSLSDISNPHPDPSYVRDDGLRDVFWIPDHSQLPNLNLLETKAREFINGEYQKHYKTDAPWSELDPERIKIKIKRKDIDVETVGGEKHSVFDVVNQHTSFQASITVIPRIWAPHLMQKEIKKGAKRALKNKEAMLSFQLTNMEARVVMAKKSEAVPQDEDGGVDVTDAM